MAALSAEQAADFLAFDGNAQGFRTLTQLENYRFDGGLRLTHATLGSLLKYAVSALDRDPHDPLGTRKKPGFFSAERDYVEELWSALGLSAGARHPLVYLTEAADDICYAIVDLEDGHAAGLLDHREAVEVLSALADQSPDTQLGRQEQLQKLRGIAIGRLVDAASEAFLELEPTLIEEAAIPELCSLVEAGPVLAHAKMLARERLYAAPSVVERLLGGQVVLAALLDTCVPVAEALAEAHYDRNTLRGRMASIAQLFGSGFTPRTRYDALLGVTDFLSGLTDHAALALHRRLAGFA
jgi:dGTPase